MHSRISYSAKTFSLYWNDLLVDMPLFAWYFIHLRKRVWDIHNIWWMKSSFVHDSFLCCLTHWSRVMHICVSNLTSIGSDNGLSADWRQAIIWTNAGILLIGTLGTNFDEILIRIQIFSFKKMHLKVSSTKWRPFCLGLNVLKQNHGPSNPHSSFLLNWCKYEIEISYWHSSYDIKLTSIFIVMA